MKNFLAIVVWVTGAALVSAGSAFGADTAADAAQVKLQASSTADLRKSAAGAVAYQLSDIEVKSTAHQITVTVVNSKLNSGVAADRTGEVLKIVPAIERAIAGKAGFGQVMVIHVNYVKRLETQTSLVQGFDFNKTPAGSFVLHRT